jgi:atypical dual specificity phosphatase
MGMSRSATVVCAYLVATTEMIVDEAIAFVKKKRSIIQPNSGFKQQLEEYAKQFYRHGAKQVAPSTIQSSSSLSIAERIRLLKDGNKASEPKYPNS